MPVALGGILAGGAAGVLLQTFRYELHGLSRALLAPEQADVDAGLWSVAVALIDSTNDPNDVRVWVLQVKLGSFLGCIIILSI